MTANASPSPTFAARFSDGRTAATNQAEVRFSATGLVIRAPGHDEATTWPYARLRTAQPLSSRSTDVLVTDRANEGATLFVTSAGFVRELSARASHLTAGSMRWQHALPWVIFGGVTAAIVGAFWLIDFSPARAAARLLPDSARQMLGKQVVSQMIGTRRICDDEAGRAVLETLATQLQTAIPGTPKFKIVVADWGLVNAFAAPGSQIVLTRGLLARAESPDEVAGVLAHEMGHGIELHPETGIVRAIGLTAAADLVMGGGSGTITNVGVMLAQLSYTRGAERQADEIALDILKGAKISADGLKNFLSRVKKTESGSRPGGALDLLRTHPATADRIGLIEKHGKYPATPSLTPEDWTRLREICGPVPAAKSDGDKPADPDRAAPAERKKARPKPQPPEPQIRL